MAQESIADMTEEVEEEVEEMVEHLENGLEHVPEETEQEMKQAMWQQKAISTIAEESEVSDEENITPPDTPVKVTHILPVTPVKQNNPPVTRRQMPPRIFITPAEEPHSSPRRAPLIKSPSRSPGRSKPQAPPPRKRNALMELTTQQATGRKWQRKVHNRRQAIQNDMVNKPIQ